MKNTLPNGIRQAGSGFFGSFAQFFTHGLRQFLFHRLISAKGIPISGGDETPWSLMMLGFSPTEVNACEYWACDVMRRSGCAEVSISTLG